MVSPENLGRQWPEVVFKPRNDEPILDVAHPDLGEHPNHVKVYRGFETHPDNIDYNNLGQHWTLAPHMARFFAQREEEAGGYPEHAATTVIEGLVHKKHFLTAEHPGATEFWKRHMGVGNEELGDAYSENELPVLKGAPVSITKVWKIPALEGHEGPRELTSPEEVAPPTSLGRA